MTSWPLHTDVIYFSKSIAHLCWCRKQIHDCWQPHIVPFSSAWFYFCPDRKLLKYEIKTCEDHKCRITHFNSNLGNFIKAKKAENVYESPSGYNKYSKKVLSAKWNTAALWGINCFIIISCHSSAVTSSPLQVFKAPCLLNSEPESMSGMVLLSMGM